MSPSRLLSSNFCTSRRGTLSDTSLDAHDNDGFVAKVETAHPHPKSYAYSNSHDPDGPVDHGSPRRKSSNALSFLRVSFSSALLPREKANVRRKQRSSSNTSMMPNPFSRLRPHRRSRENHVSSKSILHPKHVVRPAQPPHPPSHPPDQRLNPGPEAKGEDKDRQEESARRKSETQFTDLPPSYRDWGRAQRSRKRPPAHPSHIPLFRSASPPSPKASSQLILAVHPDPRPNPPRRLSLDTLSIISYGAAAGSILEVGEPLTDSEEDARPPLRPVEAESVPILVPMSDSESETESSDESDYSSDKGGPVEKPFPGDLGDGRSKYERIEARWRRSVSGMGWRHSIQSKSCLLGAVCVSVYNPLDDLNRQSLWSMIFPLPSPETPSVTDIPSPPHSLFSSPWTIVTPTTTTYHPPHQPRGFDPENPTTTYYPPAAVDTHNTPGSPCAPGTPYVPETPLAPKPSQSPGSADAPTPHLSDSPPTPREDEPPVPITLRQIINPRPSLPSVRTKSAGMDRTTAPIPDMDVGGFGRGAPGSRRVPNLEPMFTHKQPLRGASLLGDVVSESHRGRGGWSGWRGHRRVASDDTIISASSVYSVASMASTAHPASGMLIQTPPRSSSLPRPIQPIKSQGEVYTWARPGVSQSPPPTALDASPSAPQTPSIQRTPSQASAHVSFHTPLPVPQDRLRGHSSSLSSTKISFPSSFTSPTSSSTYHLPWSNAARPGYQVSLQQQKTLTKENFNPNFTPTALFSSLSRARTLSAQNQNRSASLRERNQAKQRQAQGSGPATWPVLGQVPGESWGHGESPGLSFSLGSTSSYGESSNAQTMGTRPRPRPLPAFPAPHELRGVGDGWAVLRESPARKAVQIP